jgi:hypothetical protein
VCRWLGLRRPAADAAQIRSGGVETNIRLFEYWYSRLKPYVDFWPLRTDLLDTREVVAYLNKNPLLAKEMGVAGAAAVNTYVNYQKVNCYVIKVVEAYQLNFLQEIDIEGLGSNVVEIEAKLV